MHKKKKRPLSKIIQPTHTPGLQTDFLKNPQLHQGTRSKTRELKDSVPRDLLTPGDKQALGVEEVQPSAETCSHQD